MEPSQQDLFDTVIIGGGPAGLSAALVLARACRRVVVIDAGHPRNAAARELHSFLSRDGIPPRELLNLGRAEVQRYGVTIVADRVVQAECIAPTSVQAGRTRFSVTCASGKQFAGRKLLFASGICDVLPDWPGVKECYGATVHHCPYCDGWEHRGKRLLTCGDMAAHAAGLGLCLRTWSPQVVVLLDDQTLEPKEAAELRANQIVWRDERVVRLLHDGDRLKAVEFASGEVLEAEALFFNMPQSPCSELAMHLGCKLDEGAKAKTTAKQQTNVPGVFFAGDADGDVQFVVVAAAEGATAAVAINRELQDEDRAAAK